MKFLPGSDGIIEETIELLGIANALFVSSEAQSHLFTHPYIARGLEENGRRLIIEKLLSIAIRLRFLDDQSNLLATHDRCNAGVLIIKEVESHIGLREVMNKVIHHKSIELFAKSSKTTVTDQKKPFPAEEIQIAEGSYSGFSIFVRAEGTRGNESWRFHTELIHLTNEIFRVFYFENLKDENSIHKA